MSTWVVTDAPGRVTLWRVERRARGVIVVRRWVQRRKTLRAEESWTENEWNKRNPHPAPPHMIDEAERHLAYRAVAMSTANRNGYDAPNAKGGA